MKTKQSRIPAWYSKDWEPAISRSELQPMTWEAVEAVVDQLLSPLAKQMAAKALFRTLWLESSRMEPMDLLQAFLTTGAAAFDPGRSRPSISLAAPIPTPATGKLPRWSYTDLEVALTYTWKGAALTLATERHRDLLAFRGEMRSPVETVRDVMMLLAGLPTPVTRTPATRNATEALIRTAA